MAAGILEYAMSLTTSAFTGPMKAATGAIGGMGSAVAKTSGLVLKLGTGLGALAGGVGILSSLSKAADMESLNVSMRVLIGNAEEATRVMRELSAFAGATPFSTTEVMEAGKALIALGSSTETLTAELRALGDVSSGMQIPLKDMVDIYGKARTQGTLFAEDLNQLASRGVPIFQELARVLNVSEGEIKKLASEGQITFPMLQQVFSDLTAEGGKFYGMMAEQSGTTKGLLSTLKSELDNLLIAIGTPINDFLKPIIEGNIERMQALNTRVAAFLQLLSAAREQGSLGEFLGASLQVAIIEAINTFSGGLRGVVAYLAAAIPPIFTTAVDILTSERTLLFFESVFKGAGEFLKSAVLSAAADLSGILREGVINLASIVNPLFGEDLARRLLGDDKSGQFRTLADSAAQSASIRFGTAAAALAGADFSGTFAQLGQTIQAAHQAGAAAFAAAKSDPLIDSRPAWETLKNLGQALNPKAIQDLLTPPVAAVAKQTGTLAQTLGLANIALQKATPKPPTAPRSTPPVPRPATSLASAGASAARATASAPRRGLLDAAETAEARLARGGSLGRVDRAAVEALGRSRGLDSRLLESLTGRALLDAVQDAKKTGLGGRLINPERAAAQLARGNGAADPRRARREAQAEAAREAADPLYRVVKAIEAKFEKLVTV